MIDLGLTTDKIEICGSPGPLRTVILRQPSLYPFFVTFSLGASILCHLSTYQSLIGIYQALGISTRFAYLGPIIHSSFINSVTYNDIDVLYVASLDVCSHPILCNLSLGYLISYSTIPSMINLFHLSLMLCNITRPVCIPLLIIVSFLSNFFPVLPQMSLNNPPPPQKEQELGHSESMFIPANKVTYIQISQYLASQGSTLAMFLYKSDTKKKRNKEQAQLW